jgi:hypothetical protein
MNESHPSPPPQGERSRRIEQRIGLPAGARRADKGRRKHIRPA